MTGDIYRQLLPRPSQGSTLKTLATILALIFSSAAAHHAQAVDFKSLTCSPVPSTGAATYNTNISCSAVLQKASVGGWVNSVGKDCSSVCSSRGLINTYSPDGFKCTSGENRPWSAIGVVDFSPTGCWHSCSAPEGSPGSASVGSRCYHPTQKRDNDRTDTTVGCFCATSTSLTEQIELGIHSGGTASLSGISATHTGFASVSSLLVNDKPGRIFDLLGSMSSGATATLSMQVNVKGACGTTGVISGAISHQGGTIVNSQQVPIILPACPALQTQCSDGIDNDNDGKFDSLNEISATDGKTFTTNAGLGSGSEFAIMIGDIIRQKKLPFTATGTYAGKAAGIVRADNTNWVNQSRDNPVGDPDLGTLTQVCRILGYRDHVSSTCRDAERSSRYPNGKCNYHSVGDNYLWRFNGSDFKAERPDPKYSKSWITSITCVNTLAACSDGWDNDGDGKVDMADDGCASANDNDERPHDPNCTKPTDPSEFGQCNDGIDNDGDGVSDKNDPGCWKDPTNPATYDPNAGPESNATTQCQDTKDNDGDTLVDAKDPGCFTNPKDPATYDRTRNNEALAGPGECMDGKDNDGDGVADKLDPGCWTNPLDPNTYNPYGGPESSATTQCQDTKDNDGDTLIDAKDPGCFTNPKDPATYDRTRNNEALAGPGECMDGKDNDNDGVADKLDPGCWTNPLDPNTYNPYGGPESSATTQCQDTKDNDADTLIDAKDPGCWKDPKDPATYDRTRNNEAAAGPSECSDGKDNDNDGVSDKDDPGCWKNPTDPNTYDPNGGPESSATTQCQDTKDNDADTLIDAKDPGCWKDPSNASTYDRTRNNEGVATSQCQDTIDNDKDGLVDMKDPGCTDPTDNDETNKATQCSDKIDNDNDNLIDLADPGCKDATDDDESDEPSLLTVGIECVVDNTDKTKTAYFSYNNTTTTDLTVTTDAQAGTLNDFVTSGSKTAPPTVFKAGLSKGTVVATFSSDALTWVVRAPKSALSQASANAQTPRCGKIVPVAECRGYKNGLMNVRFGYTNPNAFQLSVAVGQNNAFSPGIVDRGQPVKFFAGKNSSVFEAPLTSADEVVTWSINGSAVTAPTTLPTCDGQCTDVATSSITGNLDAIAGQLSGVMNRAAQLLASAKANLSKAQIKRNKVDAQRAQAKAAEYEQAANEITIQYPAVAKTCPQAPPFCVTVDRGPSLDALRGLYANQRNSVQRTIARTYFRNTGSTTRKDSLVKQAKDLEQQGLAALLQLPRVVVECK